MNSIKHVIMESKTTRKILAWLFVHAPRVVPFTPLRETV